MVRIMSFDFFKGVKQDISLDLSVQDAVATLTENALPCQNAIAFTAVLASGTAEVAEVTLEGDIGGGVWVPLGEAVAFTGGLANGVHRLTGESETLELQGLPMRGYRLKVSTPETADEEPAPGVATVYFTGR